MITRYPKLVPKGAFVVSLLVAIILNMNCLEKEVTTNFPLVEDGISRELANKLLEIARAKAEELHYEVDNLNYSVSRENDLYTVMFYPKPEPGFTRYGGGLIIRMNQKGAIVEIEPGV